jgi:hypothetical protein
MIKTVGSSYGYDLDEIAAAAQAGMPLDAARASACRRAVETKLDDLLASGSTKHNIEGLINPTDAQSYTLVTKAKDGSKLWGTVGAPNATPDEITQDLMGVAAARVEATKGVFTRYTIALPIAQYNLASQMRMGLGAETTPLKFALANSPFIEAIVPWYKMTGAGSGGLNRMICYARNPEVLAGIVPRRFTPQPPQPRNLAYVVNCTAKCGGIVLRYGAAFAKADGL